MAKTKSQYLCGQCGGISPKWAGQCPDCGAWNSLEETRLPPPQEKSSRFAGYAGDVGVSLVRLDQVAPEAECRSATGIRELDRVLGGGLVRGSVVLLGGDPGIGKSTLLLQTLSQLPPGLASLYVSGEESPQQVSMRASRLGLRAGNIQLLPETHVETLLQHADRIKPAVMIIDSIQTIYSHALQSAPGSVAQVRETAAQLVRFAKQRGVSVVLVGHVTKEGSLAGPRVLEHMVDTVLYFEGESGSPVRMIRAIKNRFGAVNELGVFAMTEQGLKEVSNPSALFLSRHKSPVPGSVIMVTREGTRPLLVEVQALVDDSPLANPRRISLGLEQNRLSMLLAVLHRHGGVSMFNQDVYVNVVGGVRVSETAADLAVLLAVLSSYRDRALPSRMAVFGEVGLAGEIRPVPNGQERINEAIQHGFHVVVAPTANAPKKTPSGIRLLAADRLAEVLDADW